jgi:hypothetical protein
LAKEDKSITSFRNVGYRSGLPRRVHMCENLNVELKEFVLERILYENAAT